MKGTGSTFHVRTRKLFIGSRFLETMRRWSVSVLLVPLIVMMLPGSWAEEPELEERVDLCIITYRPSDDFRTVLVEADQEKSQDEMAKLLDQVDTDDDGTITDAELRAYEDASERTEFNPNELGTMKLVLDGSLPTSVRFRTVLHGFEGAIEEERARLVTEHRHYSFPDARAPEAGHVLEGGLYAEGETRYNQAVEEFVVLEAPEGWVVAKVNQTTYGTQRVELQSFGTARYFTVAFEPTPEAPPVAIPGPTLIASLIVLTACAAWQARGQKR